MFYNIVLMICKAIIVDREDTCWIKRKVISFVKLQCKPSTKELAHFVLVQPEVDICQCDALWCTIDIHTLHRTVTLHDAFAGSVVSITTRLPVVRLHHQLVLLVPVQFSRLIRRVIHHSDRCIFNHFTF